MQSGVITTLVGSSALHPAIISGRRESDRAPPAIKGLVSPVATRGERSGRKSRAFRPGCLRRAGPFAEVPGKVPVPQSCARKVARGGAVGSLRSGSERWSSQNRPPHRKALSPEWTGVRTAGLQQRARRITFRARGCGLLGRVLVSRSLTDHRGERVCQTFPSPPMQDTVPAPHVNQEVHSMDTTAQDAVPFSPITKGRHPYSLSRDSTGRMWRIRSSDHRRLPMAQQDQEYQRDWEANKAEREAEWRRLTEKR